MLLVSSITPSGYTWAQEVAQRSVPGVIFTESAKSHSDASSDVGALFDVMGVRSPDLFGALSTTRSVAAICALIDRYATDGNSHAVWFPGSVASAVTDLQALALSVDAPGAAQFDAPSARLLRASAEVIDSGDVELLLVCPPEESASARAAAEVAVAIAAGLRVRGVAVCPMPRKVDGWPKSIRRTARGNFVDLQQIVFPIAVDRARGGEVPAFLDAGADVCNEGVVRQSDGTWMWSITIPGLSLCSASVGTWTIDRAYPTTHVVLEIDGRIVYRAVDSIVRRCEATGAVLSGDSIAITFAPRGEQWPDEPHVEAV